jgi:hypothetical protein
MAQSWTTPPSAAFTMNPGIPARVCPPPLADFRFWILDFRFQIGFSSSSSSSFSSPSSKISELRAPVARHACAPLLGTTASCRPSEGTSSSSFSSSNSVYSSRSSSKISELRAPVARHACALSLGTTASCRPSEGTSTDGKMPSFLETPALRPDLQATSFPLLTTPAIGYNAIAFRDSALALLSLTDLSPPSPLSP